MTSAAEPAVGRDETQRTLDRLARIEGQVRGVARMVQDGRSSVDIVTQIEAIKGALDGVGVAVVGRARACMCPGGSTEADLDELMTAVARMLRR